MGDRTLSAYSDHNEDQILFYYFYYMVSLPCENGEVAEEEHVVMGKDLTWGPPPPFCS